jgi:hypothetical protein
MVEDIPQISAMENEFLEAEFSKKRGARSGLSDET